MAETKMPDSSLSIEEQETPEKDKGTRDKDKGKEKRHISKKVGKDKKRSAERQAESLKEDGEKPESLLDPKELLSQLEETRTALGEAEGRYLRLRADFENYRRRSKEELSLACQEGAKEVFIKLLPILDNLERSIDSGGAPEKWREGVDMVVRQFLELLAAEGVAPIKAVGEVFDPQRHEAIAREVSNRPENEIIGELQKGYTFMGVTIRPSLVKVAAKEGQDR